MVDSVWGINMLKHVMLVYLGFTNLKQLLVDELEGEDFDATIKTINGCQEELLNIGDMLTFRMSLENVIDLPNFPQLILYLSAVELKEYFRSKGLIIEDSFDFLTFKVDEWLRSLWNLQQFLTGIRETILEGYSEAGFEGELENDIEIFQSLDQIQEYVKTLIDLMNLYKNN